MIWQGSTPKHSQTVGFHKLFGDESMLLLCMLLNFLQAKYQIPRDESLRSCYRASKQQRPKLKIHGAWCFGVTLQLGILEENTTHGSSLVQELLMITLEKAMEIYQAKGKPAPDTLTLVSDNTVKEVKNSVCLGYLASLVNHHKFRFLAHIHYIHYVTMCFELVPCVFLFLLV